MDFGVSAGVGKANVELLLSAMVRNCQGYFSIMRRDEREPGRDDIREKREYITHKILYEREERR